MSPRLLTASALCVALLAGCSGSEPAQDTSPTPKPTAASAASPADPGIDSYVALGDSFTAGPGLADLQPGAALCLRSDHNWPSLLGERLGVRRLTDVSCAGASTEDVLRGGRLGASRPQVSAVARGTDLVTVGIGGNDGNLFASLISACTGGNGACGPFARDRAPVLLDETASRIREVLDAVRSRAPDARVVLVGYLRLMPDSGSCPAIGIPAGDAAAVVAAEQALDDALARAARDADVAYVSPRAVSEGHDACADEPWTNGRTVPGDDGAPFHPRLAGMEAVARLVAAELAS